MQKKSLFYKSISTLLTALIIWTYMIFAPHQEIKELERFLGPSRAYAASAGTFELANPNEPSPPLPVDLTEPDDTIKFSWARIAGREEAVYLNIPSNQLSDKAYLLQEPSLFILGKYDPSTATGTMALMRMRQVGPNIQAEILRLTPRSFQHHFGMHLYHFAMLDWNINNDPACDFSQKYLREDAPPNIDNDEIKRKFIEYDAGMTSIPPVFFYPMDQAKINRSNFYWHQRLNNDSCWAKRGFKDFDQGDGNFHNMTEYGFYRLVALAQEMHKASAGVIATPEIKPIKSTSTKKSAFKKKVTTTVKYYLKPKWSVMTPTITGTYSELTVNPTLDQRANYSVVSVQGNHNFPVDETLIYEWSQTKSGWTGFFVFVAMVVAGAIIGALTGGVGLLGFKMLQGALVGAAIGGIGGLVASGFSPTTSTTAHLTPYNYSAYQLDPSASMSGDAKAIADRTRANWVMPDAQNTPGGVQQFVTKIDIRRAAECGSASRATDACTANPTSSIVVIPMDDPRFKTIYEEMFYSSHKMLQKYKYPFTTR